MTNALIEKTKLLDYLRENKIRKDWLASRLTTMIGSSITAVSLSHYLHGRRDLHNQFIENSICLILDVPREKIF